MDKSEIDWMVSGDTSPTGTPSFGFEWYGIRLAEKAFRPDMPDTALLDLALYLRDKIIDAEGYDHLVGHAELLLLKRMNGGRPITDQQRGDPGVDPEEYSAALAAVCSGKLTHMQLIDLAELAHIHRHNEVDEGGAEWEAIYDLTRIQILRRIQRTRLLPAEREIADIAPDQPSRLRAIVREFGYLGWLEDKWDKDHLDSIEGGEAGYSREDLRLAEKLFSPDLPDDILLRLYHFVMSRRDDEPGAGQ